MLEITRPAPSRADSLDVSRNHLAGRLCRLEASSAGPLLGLISLVAERRVLAEAKRRSEYPTDPGDRGVGIGEPRPDPARTLGGARVFSQLLSLQIPEPRVAKESGRSAVLNRFSRVFPGEPGKLVRLGAAGFI